MMDDHNNPLILEQEIDETKIWILAVCILNKFNEIMYVFFGILSLILLHYHCILLSKGWSQVYVGQHWFLARVTYFIIVYSHILRKKKEKSEYLNT